MLKTRRKIAITAVSLALLGFGTTGAALASSGSSPSISQTSNQDDEANEGTEHEGQGTAGKGEEGKDDQAAQDAACKAAGVPLTADNINYDDETGVCQLDSGKDDEGTD